MNEETYYYCARCKKYIGTILSSQCPHCGVRFGGTTEALGTVTRTLVEKKVNTKPLIYTTTITLGVGACTCSIAFMLSQISQEWAIFLKGLATSFSWQFVFIVVFFTVFLFLLRGLFGEKIDRYLLKLHKVMPRRYFSARSKWEIFHLLQRIRTILHPLARHRRLSAIVLLIIVSILALLIFSWKFNRPLDVYNTLCTLTSDLVIGLITLLIEDVFKQKEEINKSKNWQPPTTIGEWERVHGSEN